MALVAPDCEAAGSFDALLPPKTDRAWDHMLENEPRRRVRVACSLLDPEVRPGAPAPERRGATAGDGPADSLLLVCPMDFLHCRPRPDS